MTGNSWAKEGNDSIPKREQRKAWEQVALKATICVDSWAGRREFPCEIMGETKTKYVCRMLCEGWLPRAAQTWRYRKGAKIRSDD